MSFELEVPAADIFAEPAKPVAVPAFFPVSVPKLCVLSFFSFGLYSLYWFYQNWKRVRDEHGEDVSPIVRTILSGFYSYALFSRMLAHGKRVKLTAFAAGPLAAAWFLANVLSRLPDPYWLVTTLSFLCLVPAQTYANRLNTAVAPDHERNERYSAKNKTLIGVGVAWWLLVMAGLFLPEPPPERLEPKGNSPVAVQQ